MSCYFFLQLPKSRISKTTKFFRSAGSKSRESDGGGSFLEDVLLFVGCVCLSTWLRASVICSPRKPRRRRAAGVLPQVQQEGSLDVSSSFFRGRFLFQRAICYRRRQISVRLHCDLFGSLKRNEHAQSTDPVHCAQRRPRACVVPNCFKGSRTSYLAKILRIGFAVISFRTKLSSSAFARPVTMRQRSTERRRATMAFLRAAAALADLAWFACIAPDAVKNTYITLTHELHQLYTSMSTGLRNRWLVFRFQAVAVFKLLMEAHKGLRAKSCPNAPIEL